MYNRILNRPMFKRGGDVIDSQGSGITSGLDTPRSNYLGGGTIGGGTIHGNPIGNRTGFDEPSLLPRKQPEITPLEQLRYNARRKAADTEVTSEQYSSNALDAFASGFLNPKARTMGEALFYTNEARKAGIKPLEEKAAERKFEFEKIPLEIILVSVVLFFIIKSYPMTPPLPQSSPIFKGNVFPWMSVQV